MSAENFKNSSERNFRLWSLFVSITDKQQIFWKRSSRIFIILLSLLKSSRIFEIISCSSADLWFIIRSASHDLTAITQLRNILIHFIRYVFLSTWHYLVYIKSLEHIKSSLLFFWLCNVSHLRYQIKTIIFSDNFILITISCDSYKRRKTLMKKICQRFMKLTDRKRQQIYRNSYFRLLRQRYRFSFSHNSLIKSIISKIYLSRKADFKRSMKRSRNLQNYNCLYKPRIPRSSSHFIFFRLKFYRLSRTLSYSCFVRRCSTNFRFQLINWSDEC